MVWRWERFAISHDGTRLAQGASFDPLSSLNAIPIPANDYNHLLTNPRPTPTLPFDLKELTEDVAKWMVNITSPTNSTDVDVHEEDNDEDDEDDMDAVSWMNFFLSSPEFRAWLFGTPTNTTNERRRSDAPTDWDWATNKEKLVKEIDLMQKQEEATLMAAKKELVSIQRLADVVKSIPGNSTQAEKEMVPEDGMKRMAHDYETPRDELDDKEDEIEDALDALNGPMQAFSNRLEDDSSSPQPLRLRRRGHPDVDQRLQNHEEILDEVDEEAKEPKDAWRTYMTSKEKKKNDKWKAGVAHDMTQMMNHLERPKEAAARQKDKEELKKEQ